LEPRALIEFLTRAEAICSQISATRGLIHRDVGAAFNQLREDVMNLVEPERRDWFEKRVPRLNLGEKMPFPVNSEVGRLACGQLLALLETLRGRPEQDQRIVRVLPETFRVFIVHGHDGENALRVQRLLKDRWGLDPVILADQPSQGRSIIEKFEDEAGSCAFAFVLLTPDDLVGKPEAGYRQARPNVLFELGWFYGRLGRARVCLVYKRGTNIPSDLAGIGRVEFSDHVEECALALEDELRAATILKA
jgi:hypothetical protein